VVSVHKNCANFLFSPDGKELAFAASVFKPAFSRDLYLLRAGVKDPVKLKEWIYEYAFTPQGDRLFYRADCTREGRACILYSVDTTAAEPKPGQEADSVFTFKLSHDGARVAFTYAHTQGELFDVSVLNLKTKERKTIEQDVKLPVLFLDKDGSKIAYLVGDKAKAGVYVASQVP
jgi:dipeptidyl aminopeptidase/acylaminoacyl peptidase